MLRVVVRIVAGFMLAVLAAALVGMMFDLPFAASSFGFEPPAQRLLRWGWPLLPFAIPAGLFAILAAESQRWRHWCYWAPAGVLIGLLGFLFLTSHDAATRPAFLSPKALVGLSAMGLAAGHVYWWIAGHRAGLLSHMLSHAERASVADRHDNRRCWACAIIGLGLALIPFAALGWFVVHESAAPARIIAKAEADAANRLKAAGLADFALKIADHTGHVSGTAPDPGSKLKAFERAKLELAPMVGLPGVVADLQNDIVVVGKAAAGKAEDDRLAAEAAAQKKSEEEAAARKAEDDRLAAEAAAQKKSEEEAAARKAEDDRLAAEAAAQKKSEEEAAARKAEDDRLAAEAAAQKKSEEEAAARKAEDDRLAAEAAAQKKSEEEAAARKAEDDRLAAEAAAQKKSEEEAAARKAEDDRLAAEAAAQKKSEEEAAARKAEDDRLAAEAAAQKKSEEEAAARKAEDDRLAVEAAAQKKSEEEAAARKAEDDRLIEASAVKTKAVKGATEAAVDQATTGTSTSDQPAAPEAKPSQPASAPVAVPGTKAQCAADMRSLFSPTPIHFALNKADLSSEISGFLDKVAVVIKRCDGFKITIDGHADRTGPDVFNAKLSEERAEAVRAALVERGVASQRLIARGFGEQRPFDPANTKAAFRVNRRIDLGFVDESTAR